MSKLPLISPVDGQVLFQWAAFTNRCEYLDPALFWTGCKDTGRSVSLSKLGCGSVTRPKSYLLKKG